MGMVPGPSRAPTLCHMGPQSTTAQTGTPHGSGHKSFFEVCTPFLNVFKVQYFYLILDFTYIEQFGFGNFHFPFCNGFYGKIFFSPNAFPFVL